MKEKCFALAVLVAAGIAPILPVLAQVRPVESTYDSLLATIRQNNPAVRAARISASSLAVETRRVKTLPDPTIALVYQPLPVLTARGSQRTQIRIEQGFPFPGRLRLKGKLAGLSAEKASADADAFELDLLLQARLAWIELMHVESVKRHVRLFELHLRDYEEVAAQQYAVGSGPQQPILKSQLERASLTRTDIELSTRRSTASAMLHSFLGTTIDVDATVPDALYELELPADISLLTTAAFELRPEFESLRLMSESADAGIALARKDFLPDFAVNVTWFDIAPEAAPPTADGRDAIALGLSVKVPLWRAPRKASLEQQRLKREEVTARERALELLLETRLADLVAQLRAERDQLVLYEEALIPQAESTIEATISAYSTGRADFLTLLDAERMLFSLNTGYENARTRFLKARVTLERVVGVHSLEDILNQR